MNNKKKPNLRIVLEARCPKCKVGYKYELFRRDFEKEEEK